MGGYFILRRSRGSWLQTRINPVLIALLFAWSADGALADPGSAPSGSEGADTGSTPYLVLGALTVGFAATYALLLGGSDRSHTRRSAAAPANAPVGVPPQQPNTPSGTETPGGTGTSGEDDPLGTGSPAPTTSTAPTTEAPEPGTLMLLGGGVAALLAARLRRRPR